MASVTISRTNLSYTPNRIRVRYWSATIVALLIYLAINIIFEKSVRHILPNESSALTASTAVEQFKKLSPPPQIVLVGSSIMKYPEWYVDVKHSFAKTTVQSYETYHCAKWFEKELARIGINNVRISNLSVGGATVADVYLLCDKLFNDPHCPKLIIYGTAVRDIASSLFNCERNTPIFKLLFEPEDCTRFGNLFTACLAERIELEIDQRFPLYQNREVLQEKVSFKAHTWQINLLSQLNLYNQSQRVSFLKALSAPSIPKMRPNMNNRFGSSVTKELRRLANQRTCLKLLAALVQKKNTSLLLVNMPIIDKSSGLGTELYDDFHKTLYSCSKYPHTFILDLASQDSSFGSDCFIDGLHLNAKGGEKFIGCLTKWLKDHQDILSPIH